MVIQFIIKKMTIYKFFKKKIEPQPDNQQFRVIISFETLSNRKKFIKKYNNLQILSKFDFIPSICVNLTKDTIFQ
jgi:hypothetical protein